MATYIKGNKVTNATAYELAEKNSDGTYTPLGTNTEEINFLLDELGLPAGTHALVVKAVGDGVNYEDSDYSEQVDYVVEGQPSDTNTVLRTIPLPAILSAYTKASSSFGSMTSRATAYGNVKAGDTLEVVNPDDTFSNEMLIYEVQAKDSPAFGYIGATHQETYVSDLRTDYAPDSYTFEKDLRFLAVMLDRNDTANRNFTNYANFCLYNLKRAYTVGVANPIQAYYGTYDKNTSKFTLTSDIRALAVLDLKAGDVVESATDDLGFDVYKFVDKTYTFDSVLVGGTTETAYQTKTWTSDADQRVMVIARSDSNPSGTVTDDLTAVFKVTFNS